MFFVFLHPEGGEHSMTKLCGLRCLSWVVGYEIYEVPSKFAFLQVAKLNLEYRECSTRRMGSEFDLKRYIISLGMSPLAVN